MTTTPDKCLVELAQECIGRHDYSTEHNSFNYKEMEDGTILCVHHLGAGQFRCRVASAGDLLLATLADHMEDVYATTKFVTPLDPPYTLAEVEDFERENDTTIPALLRYYILSISRETACDSCRITIDLTTRNIESNKIPVTKDNLGFYEFEIDDWRDLQGTLDFSDGGCAFFSNVIVKGEGHGYVLSYRDDNSFSVKPLWKCLLEPYRFSKKI